ncbi:MAG TPA: carbohydrate porin [Hansschlegelia sp.]
MGVRAGALALVLTAALGGVGLAAEDDEAGPSILDHVPAFAGVAAARDALADLGVLFSGFYFSDPRANLSGGVKRGTTYSGLLSLAVDLDADKLVGIEGGRLHANMFQIHGRDVSERYVGNFMSADDIGARPSTRLFELWYEQKFSEQVAIRAGQMAIDVEFITSDYGEAFIDATFGWAGPPSENLPAGGPAYPLATPGVRLKLDPTENLSILAAVFNGYPSGKGAGDPETRNRHGLNFEIGDPPLAIVEGQYRYNQGEDAAGLPGTIKFGGYMHFGRFDDVERGSDGLVLGSPGSNDDPRRHRSNVNVYGVVDQQVWRLPGGTDEQGVGVFARAILGPSDRNAVDIYFDGGVVATGILPGRPKDVVGLAAAYANFSPGLLKADRAANAAIGYGRRPHGFEAVIEATYRAEIVPGLTVQPTAQYVVNPGASVIDAGEGPARRLPDATVFGVATIVRF